MSEQFNRRSALTLGATALAGLVAIPLTSSSASAEPRWRRIHEAIGALESAKEEVTGTGHEWGGHKREAVEAIDNAIHHLRVLEEWHE